MAFFPLRPQRNPLAMPVQMQMPQNGYYSGTQPMPTGSQLGLGQQVQAAIGGMQIPQRPPIGFSPLQNYPTAGASYGAAPQGMFAAAPNYGQTPAQAAQSYAGTRAQATANTWQGVQAMPNFQSAPNAGGPIGSYTPRSGNTMRVFTQPDGTVQIKGGAPMGQWMNQPSPISRQQVNPQIAAMLPEAGVITRGMMDTARRRYQGGQAAARRAQMIIGNANRYRLNAATTPAVRQAYALLGIALPGKKTAETLSMPSAVKIPGIPSNQPSPYQLGPQRAYQGMGGLLPR